MEKISTLLIICFCLALAPLQAQEFTYGFKAGLNFSTFSGELETNAAGMDVEEFDNTSGFHVGAIFNFKFTDLVGVRAELLYSQKGGRYRFEGDSYDLLETVNGNRIVGLGSKKLSINNSNSYIDIPALVFVRPLDWLELSAGASMGFLVNSTGSGEKRFGGQSTDGFPVPEYFITLDYDYFKDEAGEINSEEFTRIVVGADNVDVPVSAGAYYLETTKDGNYFNSLDVGLVGGLSLYFNKGFYVGGRVNYGLSDLTNNAYDYSQINLDQNNNRIPRTDKDRTLSFQASVGFSL